MFRRRSKEAEVLQAHLSLTDLQSREIISNGFNHTLDSIKSMPWIHRLGLSASSTDWRRKCCVGFDCSEHRTLLFCIQCTFTTYLGDGPFMICESMLCYKAHVDHGNMDYGYMSKSMKIQCHKINADTKREKTNAAIKRVNQEIKIALQADCNALKKRAKLIAKEERARINKK